MVDPYLSMIRGTLDITSDTLRKNALNESNEVFLRMREYVAEADPSLSSFEIRNGLTKIADKAIADAPVFSKQYLSNATGNYIGKLTSDFNLKQIEDRKQDKLFAVSDSLDRTFNDISSGNVPEDNISPMVAEDLKKIKPLVSESDFHKYERSVNSQAWYSYARTLSVQDLGSFLQTEKAKILLDPKAYATLKQVTSSVKGPSDLKQLDSFGKSVTSNDITDRRKAEDEALIRGVDQGTALVIFDIASSLKSLNLQGLEEVRKKYDGNDTESVLTRKLIDERKKYLENNAVSDPFNFAVSSGFVNLTDTISYLPIDDFTAQDLMMRAEYAETVSNYYSAPLQDIFTPVEKERLRSKLVNDPLFINSYVTAADNIEGTARQAFFREVQKLDNTAIGRSFIFKNKIDPIIASKIELGRSVDTGKGADAERAYIAIAMGNTLDGAPEARDSLIETVRRYMLGKTADEYRASGGKVNPRTVFNDTLNISKAMEDLGLTVYHDGDHDVFLPQGFTPRKYEKFKKGVRLESSYILKQSGLEEVTVDVVRDSGKWFTSGAGEYVIVLDLFDKQGASLGSFPVLNKNGNVKRFGVGYNYGNK